MYPKFRPMNSAELLGIAKLPQSRGLKNGRINLSQTGPEAITLGEAGSYDLGREHRREV